MVASYFSSAAQIKIELKTPVEKRRDYIFIKPSDTVYVKVGHSEDMGAWGSIRYYLKQNIPDGAYDIYLDDSLATSGFIKNFQKAGQWHEYYPDGTLKSITGFRKGKLHGKIQFYNRNGSIKTIDNYKAGKQIWREVYDNNGKLQSKTHYYEHLS